MVDYFYYREKFLGKALSEDDFLCVEPSALAYVKYFVGPKFIECDDIYNAVCAVCEVYFKFFERDGIISENCDGISQNFSNVSWTNKADEVISIYLSGTNLLYRGLKQ